MRNLFAIILLICSFSLWGHEAHEGAESGPLAVSLAFDAEGTLWRAGVKDGFVQVDASTDLGKTFSVPVKVNISAQSIPAKNEARPKIAIAANGNIYVTWTEALKQPYSGYVWFGRSINHGKSFEKPFIVHQDRAEITHRFDALNVSPNGVISVAWIDKRDLIAAKKAGKPYDGAAIYYAVSKDNGATFLPEQKLADSSCECCRIAMISKPDNTVSLLWRHVFADSERDHAMAEINTDKPVKIVRASFGHWKIDGCPHQGPALADGVGFGYHMAYFDGAGDRPSLKYARMDSAAWVTSPPKRFGNNQNQAAHPTLLSLGDRVWLAWRESNADKGHTIYAMHSEDGGKNWSDAARIFSSDHKTDYPQLLSHENNVYLLVNTQLKGLKVIKMSATD